MAGAMIQSKTSSPCAPDVIRSYIAKSTAQTIPFDASWEEDSEKSGSDLESGGRCSGSGGENQPRLVAPVMNNPVVA